MLIGKRTYFIYDGSVLLGEITFDIISGQVKDEGYYIFVSGSYYPLEMVVLESEQWKSYACHNDHLGTPKVMTNQAGDVVWEAIYEPFGEIDRYLVNRIPNNFRFPGQYEDELTGLYYNHYRYYISHIGRYNRNDPYGHNRCEVDILGYISDYVYVNNIPVKFVDPEGTYTVKNCKSWGADVINALIKVLNTDLDKCACNEKIKKEDFKKAVHRATWECKDTEFVDKVNCAQVIGKYKVEIGQCALKEKCYGGMVICGCLTGTLFHEALHLYGIYDEHKVDKISKKCFSCYIKRY
ncbi:MAG: RHS repeat domain-containing protein [Candidatus Helarchaeota archaeon]